MRGAEPATVRIEETEIEVSVGDRLVAPPHHGQKPTYFFPRPADAPVDGRILDAYDTIGRWDATRSCSSASAP